MPRPLRRGFVYRANNVSNQNPDEVKFIAASLRNLERMVQVFEDFLPIIAQLALVDAVDNERLSDIPDWLERIEAKLERIERATVLQGESNTQAKTVTGQLRREMQEDLIASAKDRLRLQIMNREQLLNESAKYGGSPPLELTNKLIAVNQKIEEAERELRSYQGMK